MKYLLLLSLILFSISAWTMPSPLHNVETSDTLKYTKLLRAADTAYFKGNWEKAIPLYKKALNDTSKNALLWQRLAYANFMAHHDDEAVKYYQRSLDNKPPFGLKFIIQTNLLLLFERQKNPDGALVYLKKAVTEGYSNFIAFDSLTIFRNLKDTPSYKEVFEKARLNAYPCLSDIRRSDFDFWVGEWDVYQNGTNSLVGRSSVMKVDGGCVLIENFQSLVLPQSGHSINYFDAVQQKWEQVYSGSNGLHQRYVSGEYKDNKMQFVYESLFQGKPFKGRFTFYNLSADKVRQFQEFSPDGGVSFQPSYDFIYIRRSGN